MRYALEISPSLPKNLAQNVCFVLILSIPLLFILLQLRSKMLPALTILYLDHAGTPLLLQLIFICTSSNGRIQLIACLRLLQPPSIMQPILRKSSWRIPTIRQVSMKAVSLEIELATDDSLYHLPQVVVFFQAFSNEVMSLIKDTSLVICSGN